MTTAAPKKRIPHFTTYVSVDVDIDPDDLRADGWHHEDECEGVPRVTPDENRDSYLEVIQSLHRQAHPGQHRDVAMCHEEPCRRLRIDQLRGRPS